MWWRLPTNRLCPANRWTRAAGACFASSVVRRRLNEFAPPGQLHRYVARKSRVGRFGMRRLLRQTSGCLVILICVLIAQGTQDYSARLISTLDKLKAYLGQSKPEWRHSPVEPIKGSRNVSVNNWELNGQFVRVSILAYASEGEASEAMRDFASDVRTLDRLPELGDGGYSWSMGGSNICFRKGDLTIWVSTSVTNLREAVKLSQEFAKEIEAALTAT